MLRVYLLHLGSGNLINFCVGYTRFWEGLAPSAHLISAVPLRISISKTLYYKPFLYGVNLINCLNYSIIRTLINSSVLRLSGSQFLLICFISNWIRLFARFNFVICSLVSSIARLSSLFLMSRKRIKLSSSSLHVLYRSSKSYSV